MPPSSTFEQPSTPSVTPSMAAFDGNESCPDCGARMAADQRYCLSCGHRRGDPRLPFMDAVAFMESMGATGSGVASPPPPPPGEGRSSSRMNANAALIAGVATLVLAIGVGFLIGRSGHENAPQAAAAPQIIKVGGGGEEGGGSEEAAATEGSSAAKGGKAKGGKSKGGSKTAEEAKTSPKATAKAKENSEVGEHGASKATEEVLHTEGDVKLAEPEVKVGGECAKGTAGCGDTGKFEGNFFGE
jgi:hypothetical protein